MVSPRRDEDTGSDTVYVNGEPYKLAMDRLVGAEAERDHWKAMHDEQVRRKRVVGTKLSHWIRLFNRLEKAVSNHEKAKAGTGFTDDADDALHAAWKRVMRDACSGSSGGLEGERRG